MDKLIEYADVFTSSEEYANRFSGVTGAWLVERQNHIIHDYLKRMSPASILDLAGGHGHIANAFGDNYKITILSSNDDCSKQIKNNKCIFESGDIENLKYTDSSFDVVTCLRYLSHTENWQKVIAEMCRVAKKAIIIDYPPLISFNLLSPLLYKLKKNIEGNTRTYTVFKHSEIVGEFERNNYKLSFYNGQFFFPMVVHRIIQNPQVSEAIEFLPKKTRLTDLFGSPSLACFVKEDT